MSTDITLFALAEEFQATATKLYDSELDEQTIADTLEGLQYPIEEKAKNVAFVIRNLEANEIAIKQAENSLQQRRARLAARREWLEGYLLANMQRCGISKIEHPLATISLRANPGKVAIIDEAAIPWEYMRQPPQPPAAPEKTLIRDALKRGEEVPGARLEVTQRVEIKI